MVMKGAIADKKREIRRGEEVSKEYDEEIERIKEKYKGMMAKKSKLISRQKSTLQARSAQQLPDFEMRETNSTL